MHKLLVRARVQHVDDYTLKASSIVYYCPCISVFLMLSFINIKSLIFARAYDIYLYKIILL